MNQHEAWSKCFDLIMQYCKGRGCLGCPVAEKCGQHANDRQIRKLIAVENMEVTGNVYEKSGTVRGGTKECRTQKQ